jgi:hypothetical protein
VIRKAVDIAIVLGFANYAHTQRVQALTYLLMDIHVAEGDISGQNTTMVMRHPPKNKPLTRVSG